jgi:hypothetical protein
MQAEDGSEPQLFGSIIKMIEHYRIYPLEMFGIVLGNPIEATGKSVDGRVGDKKTSLTEPSSEETNYTQLSFSANGGMTKEATTYTKLSFASKEKSPSAIENAEEDDDNVVQYVTGRFLQNLFCSRHAGGARYQVDNSARSTPAYLGCLFS